MKKVIIFGSGGVGIKAMKKLQDEGCLILCFADNSSSKWGMQVENLPVIPPSEILMQKFDYVAIGVYKAIAGIKNQLLEMGIHENQILIPIKADRIFPNVENISTEQLVQLEERDYQSANTRKYQELNIQLSDKIFLNKLEKLKEVLAVNKIPRQKVCIVGGAVLQVFALRESKEFDDIDVIMTSDLRKLYGSGLIILSDTAEMHKQDQYCVSDDEIICNIENYFVYSDIKFLHPWILREYTRNKSREEYEVLKRLLY